MIIENKYRSRACGEVSESDIGKVIRVAGWVENIRDHGGIRFVDLRDQYGIVQVVIPEDSMLDGVRKETVVTIEGEVTRRDPETVQPEDLHRYCGTACRKPVHSGQGHGESAL